MKFSKLRPLHYLLLAAAASLAVSLFSDQLDPYFLQVLILIGINIILAVSLNLVMGHTGQFSLGHAGFMAVGAYASASLTLFAGPAVLSSLGGGVVGTTLLFAAALALGGAAAGVAGLLVGIPSLRLRGDYLAIVTLGFAEIIRVILQNTEAVGGARGLSGIPQYTDFFWTYTLVALTICVIASLINSTYGRGFLAVRDDEIAAEAMGINTTKYKVIAFVISAFFAGIAGALYAHAYMYINPEGFNFLKSIDAVIMVILGGMGSTLGVAAAAVLITTLNEFLREFEAFRMVVFALLLIIMMILRPQGLFGNFRGFRRKRPAVNP